MEAPKKRPELRAIEGGKSSAVGNRIVPGNKLDKQISVGMEHDLQEFVAGVAVQERLGQKSSERLGRVSRTLLNIGEKLAAKGKNVALNVAGNLSDKAIKAMEELAERIESAREQFRQDFEEPRRATEERLRAVRGNAAGLGMTIEPVRERIVNIVNMPAVVTQVPLPQKEGGVEDLQKQVEGLQAMVEQLIRQQTELQRALDAAGENRERIDVAETTVLELQQRQVA